MQPVTLLSLATAVPPHRISQVQAKEIGRELFSGRKALYDRLSGVFDNAGIGGRNIVAPLDWYAGDHGWQSRNDLYLRASEQLFEEVALKAIAAAGLQPSDVDGVVSVSTTGIATPSLEARVGPRIGLKAAVQRVPVFGLGCAGGVSGLATAARLAAADPGSRWLFVCVETCSISIRLDTDDPAALVATALFGDGAAAALVSTSGKGHARITGAGERQWPETLGIMGWRVEDPGLAVVFDRAIPPFVTAELAAAVDAILMDMDLTRGDVGRLCSHPGGAKVITAIEEALDLDEGSLDLERQVLHDHGNMSAPTVLFVLERLLDRGLPERAMMTAFGPGFTCSGLMLERA